MSSKSCLPPDIRSSSADGARPRPACFPVPSNSRRFRSIPTRTISRLSTTPISSSMPRSATCSGKYRGGEGDDPEGFRRLNLDGTVKLFDTAKRAGTRRCIFISSRAVYQDAASRHGSDRRRCCRNRTTVYGEVKLDGERALAASGGPGFAGCKPARNRRLRRSPPNKWDGLIERLLERQTSARSSRNGSPRPRPRPRRAADAGDRKRPHLRRSLQRFGYRRRYAGYPVVVQQETDCPNALPAAADKAAVNRHEHRKAGERLAGCRAAKRCSNRRSGNSRAHCSIGEVQHRLAFRKNSHLTITAKPTPLSCIAKARQPFMVRLCSRRYQKN